MLDTALHVGHEHPGLIWILASSVLSFIVGVGIGSRSAMLREWLYSPGDATSD